MSGDPLEHTEREKPNPLHRFLEAFYGRVFRAVAWLGIPPWFIVTMEVKGRSSDRPRSTVLVLAEHLGRKYAVSVVGERSDWVQNVRAAGGRATIQHGRRRKVALSEIPVNERAPILKAYLKWSLGARAVMNLGPGSEIERFESIAAKHPVFLIEDLAAVI